MCRFKVCCTLLTCISSIMQYEAHQTSWVLYDSVFYELHTVRMQKIGTDTHHCHFHLLLRKHVPCSISANDSRWRMIQVRGMLHSELYASQSLTIPFFPFSFVSHVDHLLISLKIGGICKHKGHYNLCKIPRKHSYVDTLLHFSASKALSSHAGH